MWMAYVIAPAIEELKKSVAKYPNIKPGTEDFKGYDTAKGLLHKEVAD